MFDSLDLALFVEDSPGGAPVSGSGFGTFTSTGSGAQTGEGDRTGEERRGRTANRRCAACR